MKTEQIVMLAIGILILVAFIGIYVLQGIGIMQEVAAEFKGALISAFTLVLGYYFGSSKGSRDKDSKV